MNKHLQKCAFCLLFCINVRLLPLIKVILTVCHALLTDIHYMLCFFVILRCLLSEWIKKTCDANGSIKKAIYKKYNSIGTLDSGSSFYSSKNRVMVSGVPFSVNRRWIPVSCSPFGASHFCFMPKDFQEAQIILNIGFWSSISFKTALVYGFRSSVWFKLFWISLNGAPFSTKLFELRLQEFPKA